MTVFDQIGKIPPEVGRFIAWQLDGDLKQIPLANCTKVLPAEILASSGASFKSSVERGLTLCLDPKEAKTAQLQDGTGAGLKDIAIQFTHCRDDPNLEANITCNNLIQTNKWLEQHKVLLEFYVSKTKIDFLAKSDYFSHSMEWIAAENFESAQRNFNLRVNDVRLEDSLFALYDRTTDRRKYLTVANTLSTATKLDHTLSSTNLFSYEI